MLLTLARPIPTIPERLDDPACTSDDVEYLLRSVNAAMESSVTRDHVIGVWSGLRPLVTSDDDSDGRTADVSRRHRVDMSSSGYVRVVGGNSPPTARWPKIR